MIAINPIQPHQSEAVKSIIFTVCHEIWQVSDDIIKRYDEMHDLDNVRSHYFDNDGTFLVLVDDEKVVGSGAIRNLNNPICELKRMWLLKDYRGRGLGMKMAQRLFDFAKKTGYEKVRLDLVDTQKQEQALKFYKKLGFYFIERYNDSLCSVFMEKIL